jgi:hypothetical protein
MRRAGSPGFQAGHISRQKFKLSLHRSGAHRTNTERPLCGGSRALSNSSFHNRMSAMSSYNTDTINYLKHSSPAQAEFYQAAEEVLTSLKPLLDRNRKYQKHNIIQRIVEPERQIFSGWRGSTTVAPSR